MKKDILFSNCLNSIFTSKDIYKLLYDICKTVNINVSYETIKLLFYGVKEPACKLEEYIVYWIQIFYKCYYVRLVPSINSHDTDVLEFKKYDIEDFISVLFNDYKQKSSFEKGKLLIYFSILTAKYYGVIFRYFCCTLKKIEESDISFASDYLKGAIIDEKISSKERISLDFVIDVLKENKKFFTDEEVRELYLFGSVAKNTHTLHSDIDLLIYYEDITSFKKSIHKKNIYEFIFNTFHCPCDIVEEQEILFDDTTDAFKTAIKIF